MQIPQDPEVASSILRYWYELYSQRVYLLKKEERKLTKELSLQFDQEATAEIKLKYPYITFPIELEKKNIPVGRALLFDAHDYLHAGGPGKTD